MSALSGTTYDADKVPPNDECSKATYKEVTPGMESTFDETLLSKDPLLSRTFASESGPISSLKDLSTNDDIGPINVDIDENQRIIISDMTLISKDFQEFETQLELSMKKWNETNPRYVQINFSKDHSHLTCVAEKLGFEFDASHYGEDGEIVMVYFTP